LQQREILATHETVKFFEDFLSDTAFEELVARTSELDCWTNSELRELMLTVMPLCRHRRFQNLQLHLAADSIVDVPGA